jgi:hypothetical protein
MSTVAADDTWPWARLCRIRSPKTPKAPRSRPRVSAVSVVA